MAKDAVFTMKLESELRDAFLAEAEAAHRPASQVVRELMRDYVRRQGEEREYRAFLERKVETARRSVQADRGLADDVLEEDFRRRRADLLEASDPERR